MQEMKWKHHCCNTMVAFKGYNPTTSHIGPIFSGVKVAVLFCKRETFQLPGQMLEKRWIEFINPNRTDFRKGDLNFCNSLGSQRQAVISFGVKGKKQEYRGERG